MVQWFWLQFTSDMEKYYLLLYFTFVFALDQGYIVELL